MHVWIVEVKAKGGNKWIPYETVFWSRDSARFASRFVTNDYQLGCKTRVVKYISTKGE